MSPRQAPAVSSGPSEAKRGEARDARRQEDRLGFTLPDFMRYAWASGEARRTWEPRLARIRAAWPQMEWLSVAEGVRSCALVALSQGEVAATIPRWTARRQSALGLPMTQPESHPGVVFALVGALDVVTEARDAWHRRDNETVGRLFGYPVCCREFFRQVWVEQQSLDTTWAMAANTVAPSSATVRLPGDTSPLANILWRWLGVRAVPHLPCRFDCQATVDLAERILGAGERLGYGDEVGWIRQILRWPVEWSALHGIAEVKSPIGKIATRTDATAGKYVVRWSGSLYPAEGVAGVRFPYVKRRPRRAADVPSGDSGVARPSRGSVEAEDWYYRDNGFLSRPAMDELHQPIVALARNLLQGSHGKVLDLGCGNGALLAKICDGLPGLTPYGVERNAGPLEHAKKLMPRQAENFEHGDLFDHRMWSRGEHYTLTLLMLGRLLEVKTPVADGLLETLRRQSEAILVYVYPSPGVPSLASLAQRVGVQLAGSGDGWADLLVDTRGPASPSSSEG